MTTTSPTPLRILDLQPDAYPGGVGVWGALPAVYDTTGFLPEHGVHVHARKAAGRKKDIDLSFDAVNVVLRSGRVQIRESDAAAYVAGAVLGLSLVALRCPYCSVLHLDEGRFAVHPHQRHKCANCRGEFLEGQRSVGNPIMLAKSELGDVAVTRRTAFGGRSPRIDQAADYCAGGLLLWGSNPAIIWTTKRDEQEGIHVHAFRNASDPPTIDETYESVEVDGVRLDAAMVRIFMIQQSLPHLNGLVHHVRCGRCGCSHFDAAAPFAVEPHQNHACAACGDVTVTARPVISNPIVDVLETLYANAAKTGLRKNPMMAP